MRTTMASFLASLAILSLVVFCTPAGAGMVATPQAGTATGEAREAALATLGAHLAQEGAGSVALLEGMRAMPTADLLALAGTVESARAAGHHYVLIALGICAAAFAIFAICYWGIYRHSGHHGHHCD